MIKVYKIWEVLREQMRLNFSKEGWDAQEVIIGNFLKSNLNAVKFSFGNRVCDEWNKLPVWVVNVESMNNFKLNLDNYLRDNIGFK